MDLTSKQQFFLQKISDADSLFRMREACQEFLAATASDAASYRKPKQIVELFQALISGVRYSKDDLAEMMTDYLGISAPKIFLIMVARSEKGSDAVLYSCAADEISQFPYCWGFAHLDKLVCITLLNELVLEDCPVVGVLTKYKFRAGVSRPFYDISEMADYYDQAKLTLNIAHTLQKGTPICTADNFFLFRLLMGLRSDVDVMDFCLDEIQQLSKYDQENHSDLCDTLLIYLQNSKNTLITARKMNLHRNTVHYRIGKCQEILGHNFDDGIITFMTLVSLHILEYKRYQNKID